MGLAPWRFTEYYDKIMTPGHKKAILDMSYDQIDPVDGDFISRPMESACGFADGLIWFKPEFGLYHFNSCITINGQNQRFCCIDNNPDPACHGASFTNTSHYYPVDFKGGTLCKPLSDEDLIAFLDKLKKAVQEDDQITIAEELVQYPFFWRFDPEYTPKKLYEPTEFIKHYDEIMTPAHRKAILNVTSQLLPALAGSS